MHGFVAFQMKIKKRLALHVLIYNLLKIGAGNTNEKTRKQTCAETWQQACGVGPTGLFVLYKRCDIKSFMCLCLIT